VSIRNYRPGDESAQVAIFNAATASLPKPKPATVPEILRRTRARDFDPTTHFCAEENGQVVGYAHYHANGRVGYPWTLPGYERLAEPLLSAVLDGMTSRNLPKAFTAYRADWLPIQEFFIAHTFAKTRDIVNFYVDFVDLPTPSMQARGIGKLTPEDVPQVLALAPGRLGIDNAAELERYLFKNPYFQPEALSVLRSKSDNSVLALSIIVLDVTYADPEAIDPNAPCFRTGAFGSERMSTKRVNGLFSFLGRPDRSLHAYGIELLGHAAYQMRDMDTANGLAGQVASDAVGFIDFYQKYFRRQGSFPILERSLTS
jgi:hypothetical protein